MNTQRILTKDPKFFIRPAVSGDAGLVLKLIRELAEYERLAHEVVATEASIEESLFGPRRCAEAILGFHHDHSGEEHLVGFAVFFHSFSTFLGRPGMYLEDLFVRPDFRAQGFGRIMISYVAKLAMERGCGRFEWSVLDWNEPALRFYRSIGAQPMEEWTVQRLTGEALQELAAQF